MYLCIRNHATNMSNWCVSSAWLECLPVTQEVTGSSPVRTALIKVTFAPGALVQPG